MRALEEHRDLPAAADPSGRRGARASVPAGRPDRRRGQASRRRGRVRVALATAWTAGDAQPVARRRARQLARAAARPSTRPGWSRRRRVELDARPAARRRRSVGAARSPPPRGRGARRGRTALDARSSSSTSRSSNSGSPARRTRISAPQVAPSATKALRSSGPIPAGVSRSRKRALRSGRPPVASRSVAALRGARGQVGELVDVVDRVLVVGEDREAVGDVLQPVLGDEVRARVERVPAGAVERQRALEPRAPPRRRTRPARTPAAPAVRGRRGPGASAVAIGAAKRYPRGFGMAVHYGGSSTIGAMTEEKPHRADPT